MDLSRPSPAPTRYAGIGLVVALHLAGIYALSAGLIKPPGKPHEATILLPPIPEVPREPPRLPEPFKADKPVLKAPQPIQVPVPPIVIEPTAANSVTTTPLTADTPPPSTGPTRAAQVQPQAAEGPRIAAPGAVCSVMPRPEVPSVNWSGEAVLQVLATVRGGRVVASEFRVAQGALDARSRRALQRSVESALAGYQCQGDAMFQQDFAFRLE